MRRSGASWLTVLCERLCLMLQHGAWPGLPTDAYSSWGSVATCQALATLRMARSCSWTQQLSRFVQRGETHDTGFAAQNSRQMVPHLHLEVQTRKSIFTTRKLHVFGAAASHTVVQYSLWTGRPTARMSSRTQPMVSTYITPLRTEP